MPHLLKRIELSGFKSFAGKTVLEFPAGITAIVGPNGSGKSNVIDAIRWLLGEREAKHLRGGKSEDLIFAGTPKRPRTGLAQASLHFENRGHFFPVDFEEVAVTREVRRDGTNQYFVNGAEVRLKDLIDLMTAARLGSRGITVITQGNSDMFIRATPEERREMIEEVLGLKEFQQKKNEAERRLKNAQVNSEKAKALMEEILPHLRSLKRQTSRFEKRDEYAAELRDLENRFFGSELHVIDSELAAVKKDVAARETRAADLKKAKESAEHRLAKLETNEPERRGELKEVKQLIRQVEEKRAALSRELARLEARLEAAAEMKPLAGQAAAGISGEKLLAFLHTAKTLLEDALRDPLKLKANAERILRDIDNLFHAADERSASSAPDQKKEFERTGRMLQELERETAALYEKEKTLEGAQEEFYRVFKSVLEEVQSVRDALDVWTRESQSKTLEHERLRMRREELERRIVEIGRRPEEFGGKISNSQFLISNADSVEMERRMFRLRGELAAIGEIDEAIVKEAKETGERYAFLERESADLAAAETDLKQLIRDLSEKIRDRFASALGKINQEFQKFFELMFGGGTGKLVLERREIKKIDDEENDELRRSSEEVGVPTEASGEPGIDIKVSLPRKRLSSLDALSGGERSLVGIATVFALVSVSPPPFLVLDEIDAPLDERNARKFSEMLREFAKETQFVIVTHNRATMEAADVLYGVTLGEDGASKVLSMKFAEEATAVK